jgi:predicted ABC-type ATPase
VPHDDVAIGLADATPEHIAFVNALNAKFSEHRWKLGWGSNQIRFEAYCGGKNGYVVRRYVEDCTGLEKPIGMGPKGLDNFFRRHHGIDWNTFLSTPSDELLMKATKMASKTATEASAKPQKPKATKPKKEKAEKPATTKRTKRGRVASSSSCPPLEADGSRCITPDCIAQLEQECGKGRQTLELHTQDGKLTAERKKLHDRIIADIRREQKCVADKDPKRRPVAILTGGAPGSGKSTYLKRQLGRLLQRESGTLHIDADDIRARLPEYQGWNAMLTHDETKIIVNRLIDEVGVPCAADIIYDGTMNSPKRYLPIIEKLKSLGYAVIGYWIDVDKGVSEQRVLARYKKSGRYVPTYVIDEFYRPGAEALRADVLEKLDAWRSVESPTWKTMQTKNEGYLLGIEKYFKGTGKLHEAKLLQPTSEAAQPGGAKGARSKPQAVAPRAKKAERRPKQASTEETAVQPLPTTSGPTDADLDRVEAMMAQLEATLRNIAA